MCSQPSFTMATSFMAPCSSSPGRHCHSSQQGLPEPSQRPQPGGEGEGNAGPNSQRTWPPSPQGAVPSLTAGTALCWQCAPRARASPQNPRASKLPAPHLTSPCTNHSHTQKLHPGPGKGLLQGARPSAIRPPQPTARAPLPSPCTGPTHWAAVPRDSTAPLPRTGGAETQIRGRQGRKCGRLAQGSPEPSRGDVNRPPLPKTPGSS